ncbi:unnamed protein product [Litomosoides sigmodontis]|uniref:Uncharacterized protein n=1 Tax=Litomosoides sigmodontis TaxID=42156 RepID=A0A3P6SW94_LITSI|nr:unnamed protein product [Litomosoides sigmodontis]
MQKENDERSEMLNSVFDKNFDGKIKACINTRAEMEARAAAKEITTENKHEGVFGANLSQTGSVSDKLRTSPLGQQSILQNVAEASSIASQPPRNIADVSPSKVLSNKVESEQMFTEQADSTGKKTTKGFSEAAMTKVGHWSKNAFNFFRAKNVSSGKDGAMHGKTLEKATHAKNDRSRIKDAEIEATHKENFKQDEKPKKALRRSAKYKQSKQAEAVPKMPASTELGNTSNELKKHAARLTEAKKRLKERNATNFKKKKKTNLKKKRTHKHADGKKETTKDLGKPKKSINKR